MILLLTSSALAYTNDFSIHSSFSIFHISRLLALSLSPSSTYYSCLLFSRSNLKVQYTRCAPTHMHDGHHVHTLVRNIRSSVFESPARICAVFPNCHTLALWHSSSFHLLLFFSFLRLRTPYT